jgi:hypothetical protein
MKRTALILVSPLLKSGDGLDVGSSTNLSQGTTIRGRGWV